MQNGQDVQLRENEAIQHAIDQEQRGPRTQLVRTCDEQDEHGQYQ
jgi:hypothetical protein